MAPFPKVALLVALSWMCLTPNCDKLGKLPTEDELRKELKPGQKLVHYEREFLAGLKREIVRARILDETTNSVTEIIRTTKKSDRPDYLVLRKLNRAAIRAKHGAGGEGFDPRMNGKPSEPLSFSVQFVPGQDFYKATREISNLGGTIERHFQDVVRIKALPGVAKKIARLKSVDAVVEDPPRTVQALNMARDLDQGPLVQKHEEGWGRDLQAAIWEPNSCVNRTHPDFKRVQWEPRYVTPCAQHGPDIPFHSTMVAGAFAAFRQGGTVGLFQGHLFEVDDVFNAAEDDMWARKPNIVNASFTTSIVDGRRIDAEVNKTRGIHVFTAVGNTLKIGDQMACFGYNALCVGSYGTNATIGFYADDTLGGSSWKNVYKVERPHVLGPSGGRLASEGTLYGNGSGSSFATPAVAGLAALLIANYPFDLKQWPEAVRAVLMASAQAHPIVSEGRVIPNFNDNIDDRMGVGVPNGTRAKKIMDEHMMRYGSFLPGVQGNLSPVTFTAARGDMVRVVLTWDQCGDYNIGDAQLSVDLDMVVVAPGLPGPLSSPLVVTNFSRHDNWEVVEFTMAKAGTVTVHASAPVFRPCPTKQNPQLVNYGLAWTTTPATVQTRNYTAVPLSARAR